MRIGANLSHVGQYNENAVIHALRGFGPTSQTDIAAATGLSVQTVSGIVRNLTSRGYLTELRTESVGRGRPRVILDIVASARFALGVHIDPSLMTAVILDLRGSVVASGTSSEIDADDPAGTIERAADLTLGLLDTSALDRSRAIGTCLALPGPVDESTQSNRDSVWLPGWSDFSVGAALGDRLGMRVPVVKDTVAAVIGENWVRAGASLDSTMVFVYVGTGTGVGLSLNGEPVVGFSGNAGEVGRILVALGAQGSGGLDNDPMVLVERAHQDGILTGRSPDRRNLGEMDTHFRALCRLAMDGRARARELLTAAADRIAAMTVISTEMIDADTVVFGGPYWELVRPFYEPVVRHALDQPSARGPQPVELFSTAMGTRVGAIGAASVVLDARYVPRAPGRHQSLLG